MSHDYAYQAEQRPDLYPNLLKIASNSHIGLTAVINGHPYLVVGKENDEFLLENQFGIIISRKEFDWLEPEAGYEHNDKIIAASRAFDSPLKYSRKFRGHEIGTLYYDVDHWEVREGNSDKFAPIVNIVEHLANTNWARIPADDVILWAMMNDGRVFAAREADVKDHIGLVGSEEDLEFFIAVGEIVNGELNISATLQEADEWHARNIARIAHYVLSNQGYEVSLREATLNTNFTREDSGEDIHLKQVDEDNGVYYCEGDDGNEYVVTEDGEVLLDGQHPVGHLGIHPSDNEAHGYDPDRDYDADDNGPYSYEDHESKVSAHTPGTRVQIKHPKMKGQKGSVLESSGKDGFDDQLYVILLDNGEKVDKIPHSQVERIRSASPKTAATAETTIGGNAGIHGMTVAFLKSAGVEPGSILVTYPNGETVLLPPADRAGGMMLMKQFRMVKALGEEYGGIGNIPIRVEGPDDATVQMAIQAIHRASSMGRPGPMEGMGGPGPGVGGPEEVPGGPNLAKVAAEEDKEYKSLKCPDCGSHTCELSGPLNPEGKSKFRCLHCMKEFAHKVHVNPYQTSLSDRISDVNGNPLIIGNWYFLYSKEYENPDIIRVIDIDKDNKIIASLEYKDTTFSLHIPQETIEKQGHTFKPYGEALVEAQDLEKTASFQPKTAKSFLSAQEQQELIDENRDGRARNYGKLNLEGTHYTSWVRIDNDKDPLSRAFLW